jgi:hypothetical protein
MRPKAAVLLVLDHAQQKQKHACWLLAPLFCGKINILTLTPEGSMKPTQTKVQSEKAEMAPCTMLGILDFEL